MARFSLDLGPRHVAFDTDNEDWETILIDGVKGALEAQKAKLEAAREAAIAAKDERYKTLELDYKTLQEIVVSEVLLLQKQTEEDLNVEIEKAYLEGEPASRLKLALTRAKSRFKPTSKTEDADAIEPGSGEANPFLKTEKEAA